MPFMFAALAGLLFGAGLAIAGMTNPQKVLNFLDIAAIRSGRWDPTLLMVFAGALPVMFVAWRIQARRAVSLSGTAFQVGTPGRIDGMLLGGSALFGVGWGLVGLCPGPSVASLAMAPRTALGPAVLFFGALPLGIWLAHLIRRD